MTEFDGETYVTVSEVAKRFKISHVTCSTNVVALLAACYLPGRRRTVYRLSEVEQLSQVRIVEKQVPSSILMKKNAVESVS